MEVLVYLAGGMSVDLQPADAAQARVLRDDLISGKAGSVVLIDAEGVETAILRAHVAAVKLRP